MKESQQHNTILDLAAALKLSPATVSRALNNTSYVKSETKQRVLEMAEKLGYRKNTMAAGLRNNKTNTVGLILPKISMYFHAAVVTEIQNLLHSKGYNLIIGQSNDDPLLEKEMADTFFSSRVDALIVACTLKTEDFSHFDIFTAHHIPILFYDRVPPESYQARVIKGDDFNGGYLAGQYLAECGCKTIGLICGPLTSNLYQERSAGFKSALTFYKLPILEELFFYQSLTSTNTEIALAKMLSSKHPPDAVFVTSDKNAITLITYARDHEIAIPEQLKVIGYSNDPLTAMMSPSITTIEQFPQLFGIRVVETLMEMLKESETAVDTTAVIIPVELIKRKST